MRLEWSDDAGDHRLAASDLAVRLSSAAAEGDLRALVDDATEHCPVCQAIRGNVAMQRDGLVRRAVSAAARAGAPVALIGAAVANLACVPLFVHAFAIASPLSVALLRLSAARSSSSLMLPADAPLRRRCAPGPGGTPRSGRSAPPA